MRNVDWIYELFHIKQALNKAAEVAKLLVFRKIKKQKNVFTKYIYSWAFIFQNLNDLL